MEPLFFATPAEFRAWLAEDHETESELLVGFYSPDADYSPNACYASSAAITCWSQAREEFAQEVARRAPETQVHILPPGKPMYP